MLVAPCQPSQPSKFPDIFRDKTPDCSCLTVFRLRLDGHNYRDGAFLMLLAGVGCCSSSWPTMFINNSPSLNRQLLIRWAAEEINYESLFFVWFKVVIITMLLLLLSSLKLAGEVRRSDWLTDWLYLNILLSNTLLVLSGVTRGLTRSDMKSQPFSDQKVQQSSSLQTEPFLYLKSQLSICATI